MWGTSVSVKDMPEEISGGLLDVTNIPFDIRRDERKPGIWFFVFYDYELIAAWVLPDGTDEWLQLSPNALRTVELLQHRDNAYQA